MTDMYHIVDKKYLLNSVRFAEENLRILQHNIRRIEDEIEAEEYTDQYVFYMYVEDGILYIEIHND